MALPPIPPIFECLTLQADYEGKQWLCVDGKEVFETDKRYLPEPIAGRLGWAGQDESLCEKLITAGVFVGYHTDAWGAWHRIQVTRTNEKTPVKLMQSCPHSQGCLPPVQQGFRFFLHTSSQECLTLHKLIN
jgi:hypothetical protein